MDSGDSDEDQDEDDDGLREDASDIQDLCEDVSIPTTVAGHEEPVQQSESEDEEELDDDEEDLEDPSECIPIPTTSPEENEAAVFEIVPPAWSDNTGSLLPGGKKR
jgi:hypothetical protein